MGDADDYIHRQRVNEEDDVHRRLANQGDHNVRRRLARSCVTISHAPPRNTVPILNRAEFLYGGMSWLFIFSFYIVIFVTVIYSDDVRFPSPLHVSELNRIKGSRWFSEERARNFVKELSAVGVKSTGSYENEVLAVEYLLAQLRIIKGYATTNNVLDIDLQKVSGCFPLDFKDGMTSCYENIQNIVVKIGPNRPKNRSLLVNCHFDTVPTSPGASDDGVSCAMMLEILISLSQEEHPLHDSVIFLFNGAEENILQASHGFITQHKWAHEVIGFINLEACGAGGKQMLFQADDECTFLLRAYANSASYPQGSVIAQDIFESGLVLSETDYRIFKHFGSIPGLDFAYVKNSYVYHTKYDVPSFINPGAIQQAGDNILHLLHESLKLLHENPDIHKEAEPLVFFDFLGYFMVIYPVTYSYVFNVLLILFAVMDISMKCKARVKTGLSLLKTFTSILKTYGVRVGTLFASMAVNALIAALLGYFNCSMSWYRTPILIGFLYGTCSLAIILGIHNLTHDVDRHPEKDWMNVSISQRIALVEWLVILIVMLVYGLKSSFLCSVWVVFPNVIRSFVKILLKWWNIEITPKMYLLLHLSMQIVPLLMIFYCAWSIYNVFIPLTGRIGESFNPDIPIACFTSILVYLATSYTVNLMHVSTSISRVVGILASLSVITLFLICCTNIGFPYTGNLNSPAPLRCYILHTERNQEGTFRDSGYWVIPLDYNGPKYLAPYVKDLENADPVECETELACGMPFVLPIMSLLSKTYYVPATRPVTHMKSNLELLYHHRMGKYTHKLSFQAYGPDHMTLIFSPYHNVSLVEWSLHTGTPLPGGLWKGRQTYFIYYSYGENTGPWNFSIVLKAPENSPLLDLSFITHHVHGHDAVGSSFQDLLNTFPSWIHVTPWTCTLDSFTYT